PTRHHFPPRRSSDLAQVNVGGPSLGGSHTCALKSDSTVACWGDDSFGMATPPAGTFTQVDAGGSHTCGLKIEGTVVCWGYYAPRSEEHTSELQSLRQ